MENNNQDYEKKDVRNFSDKWMDHLFEVMMRIEDYERLARNGCSTLIDYVQNQNLDLAIIQEKNYQLFMTECSILMGDVKNFIDKKDYLELFLRFKEIKDKENSINGFLEMRQDHIANTSESYLKREFYQIIDLLSDFRNALVRSLLIFLNPEIKTKKEDTL